MTASTLYKICFLFLFFLLSSIVAQDNFDKSYVINQLLIDYKCEKKIDSVDLYMANHNGVAWIESKTFKNHKFKNDSIFIKLESQKEIDNFKQQIANNNFFFVDHKDSLPTFVNLYNEDSRGYKRKIHRFKYRDRYEKLAKGKYKSKHKWNKEQNEFLQLSVPLFTIDRKNMIVIFSTWQNTTLKIYTLKDNKWIFYKEYSKLLN